MKTPILNRPDIIDELNTVFDMYEDALIRHDIITLDRFFWDHANTVRYGVAENLYGGEEIRQWRMHCAPVHPLRKVVRRVTTCYGTDFGTVSIEFSAPDTERIGRQMQTWVRFAQGWCIVAAHVSML